MPQASSYVDAMTIDFIASHNSNLLTWFHAELATLNSINPDHRLFNLIMVEEALYRISRDNPTREYFIELNQRRKDVSDRMGLHPMLLMSHCVWAQCQKIDDFMNASFYSHSLQLTIKTLKKLFADTVKRYRRDTLVFGQEDKPLTIGQCVLFLERLRQTAMGSIMVNAERMPRTFMSRVLSRIGMRDNHDEELIAATRVCQDMEMVFANAISEHGRGLFSMLNKDSAAAITAEDWQEFLWIIQHLAIHSSQATRDCVPGTLFEPWLQHTYGSDEALDIYALALTIVDHDVTGRFHLSALMKDIQAVQE